MLLGVGIASMHYVGMHGFAGDFAMTHDPPWSVLSVLIAIATAYGGLRAFLARQGGVQLMLSAVAYGFAVSGMHYTAMAGMHLVPPSPGSHHHVDGLAASSQMLSLVVTLLCFVIAAGFLLSLVPDPRKKAAETQTPLPIPQATAASQYPSATPALPYQPAARPAPLGGIGQPPRAAPGPRLPVEGADGTHFIDTADVRSVRADAHYTKVHDGTRERMCPWSISEAEAQLDPGLFVRVHTQPHRGDGARHAGSQGRRWRDRRTRRPVAAPGAGEPRQDRRGEGPAWPRQDSPACLLKRRTVGQDP